MHDPAESVREHDDERDGADYRKNAAADRRSGRVAEHGDRHAKGGNPASNRESLERQRPGKCEARLVRARGRVLG